ncbi:hypothetical protein [Dyadobacter sp. 676]|uniref:Outer membrane protein beta-barrel domain-containing protein n=1 Tax=Dyadobacter sp. 676 TaxID=3088362 RepID=A0AAU8FJJ7_9BACT
MSDQEPVGKRMLGRLRDHTEPYQPDAWEHFELFRAGKSRKRRIVFYWLAAAALLVIFGTALLTSRIMDRRTPAKHSLAQKQTNGGHRSRTKTALSGSSAAPLRSGPATTRRQAIKSRKIHSKRKNRAINPPAPLVATRDQLPEYPPSPTGYERRHDNFTPDLLPLRPFNSPVVRFGKPHIPAPQRQMHVTPQPARAIRWGVAFSRQSNRAAHTNPELNYGLGGAMLVPLSDKIALVTGIAASKQSLNVEEPARLTAAEGLAQLQYVRYQWVNLEVPLQIQYKLGAFKNIGFAAAGGITPQTSVGQAADYHYKTRRTIATFTETAGGPVLVSTQTIEELSSVTKNDKKSTWAFGSPLYFGLGISYQWQKTAVEIEPYVKYPLGASTAERLQLTTVGIQLRLTGPLGKATRGTENFVK